MSDNEQRGPVGPRLKEAFGDKVVNKALAQRDSFSRLPRYVAEYLIAKFVKSTETAEADLANIKDQLRDRFPDPDRRELVKHRLMEEGFFAVIDRFEARVDFKSESRWASVPSLGERNVRVKANTVKENPKMLAGGLWGTGTLWFRPEVDKKHPLELGDFTPFQVNVTGIDDFVKARAACTPDEWLDFLMSSVGYTAAAFPGRRLKLILLSRLVPLVERNINFIELGPRQTGKTFLLRNTSPEVLVISGGKATAASLFVNLSTREVGILGSRKVVVFDEIANTSFGDAETTISTLKDYMESGQFSRGKHAYTSEASIVMVGNLDVEGTKPHSRYKHLFEVLPEELVDTAFLDRLHGYIPGWEIPKITRQSLSTGFGFVIDYLGAVFAELRKEEFRDAVRSLNFNRALTQRDLVAIERVTSGLLKLLYPAGDFETSHIKEVASLAVEYRQRVHDQLVVLAPGEFRPKEISFEGMTPVV